MDGGTRCPECDEILGENDKFCSNCGHPAPVAEIEQDEPEVADEVAAPKRRRILLIAGTGVAGVGLLAAAIWGLNRSSAAEEQYQASAPVLLASLDDMSTAQHSDVVRDLAGDANGELQVIEATLDEDPKADGVDRLTVMREAFASLAALQKYSVNNTEVWKDNRQPLMASLDEMTAFGGATEDAAAEGEDASRTLDSLTSRIDKAMKKYGKQKAKAKADAKDERSQVRNYRARMESLIDRYTYLRNDTGAFTTRMDNERMYMYEVSDYFTQGATDRREIADSMATLRPPQDMRAVHLRVVNAVNDGADGMDAAVSAIEDAECYFGDCYFEFNAQWGQFQDESSRITQRYGQAYDDWQAAIAKAAKQAAKTNLPDKPNL